jgi:sulfonate dioxygenase
MSISGAPEGYPEIHIVHRGAGDTKVQSLLAGRTTSVTWHSDVTYEEQPPGTTIMYMLDGPQVGGDTLFSDNAEAYRRLSPGLQKRLHGLTAMHSGVEQVESSRLMGGIVRREPVISEHPIVRTHPVTGEKALFVNPQCKFSYHDSLGCTDTSTVDTRYIVGFKKEESDMLLK